MPSKSALEEITAIKAEADAKIAKLTGEALAALNEEKGGHLDRIKIIDKEIAELTGKAPKAKKLESGDAAGDFSHADIVPVLERNPKGEKISHKTIAKTLGVKPAEVLAYLRNFPEDFTLKQNHSNYYVTYKFFEGGKAKNKAPASKADIADAKELKDILSETEGKKLSRKGFIDRGYNLKSALAIAKSDKATFAFEQNGPQGSVWLK